MAPYVIVDDSEFRTTTTLWNSETGQAGFFRQTVTTCVTNSSVNTSPKLSFSFYGSEIALYGTGAENITANYTIDGTRVRRAILNTTTEQVGKNGVQLWNLTGLVETRHDIEFFPDSGNLTLDYALYKPLRTQRYPKRIFMLDNADNAIKYEGSWRNQAGVTYPPGSPMLDSISETNVRNASFSLRFEGATIGVYGVLNPRAGRLAVTYRVDGSKVSETRTHFNGSQRVDADSWLLNHELFSRDLDPGPHVLDVTVNEITDDQVFYLDYITFEATSSTRLDPPSASASSNSSSGSSNSNNWSRNAIIAAVVALFFIIVVSTWIRRRVRSKLFRTAQEIRMQDHNRTDQYPPTHIEQNWQPPPHQPYNQWNAPAPPYTPPVWQPPPGAPPSPWDPQNSGTPLSPPPPAHQPLSPWQPPPGPPPAPNVAAQAPTQSPPLMSFPEPQGGTASPPSPPPALPQPLVPSQAQPDVSGMDGSDQPALGATLMTASAPQPSSGAGPSEPGFTPPSAPSVQSPSRPPAEQPPPYTPS
ncbi:hypothetical protein CC1G_02519 [Coprinopsis cinerea okayama7|uniref:Uncharacterized protein n=1 Tax=Coprinopsis cinerea (strain Okayama-7 / 130 / ATCC MYA-4618 / FGSC 9003) TaxID=240176 RepID=A8NBQ9_COPC7|nr:hypothetical protein CC1G_02519 [Coprinopsis cinerea okayama7\|eukprot:XP_001832257.1 hypothetical protein CC1G_02519 [Coprinopsis cinerea okayama7\